MRHASLFSGIGGFDLAAEWMGWTNVFSCEIEEFPRKVLQHHFPNTIHYEDIKQTDFSVHKGQVDILTGGFPCQPYSSAGKRLGKEDERHLWPEMLRAIREIAPRYVVGENVRGFLSWNGGLVLDEVYADLEAQGYEVGTFVLPAAGINAPHRRDRVWFIASNTTSDRRSRQGQSIETQEGHETRSESTRIMEGGSKGLRQQRDASDTNSERLQNPRRSEGVERERLGFYDPQANQSAWQDFPTQSPVCGGDDGLSLGLDGITFPKWRNQSIKAYGNAIVPQLAYRIFKAIELTNQKMEK